jgi:ABC-2 type transport system ATP-binding protein
MLAIDALTHRYGSLTALDNVSLAIPRGEFFGLLGPNGAGKSTLMSLVTGLRSPTAGTLTLDGRPLRPESHEVRATIGFVPQTLALYDDLSAEANLRFFGRLYGLSGATLTARAAEGLEAVGLADRRADKVGTFSGGMQRRLNLAAALLHRPSLLLCDEPTVGVDPQSRNALFEVLERLNAGGMTIVYSTHYMEEAARLCSRIAVIDHGHILADGTLADLLGRLPGAETVTADRQALTPADLSALAAHGTVSHEGDTVRILLRPDASLSAFFRDTEARGLPSLAFQLSRPTLEDVFLHLTGKSLRDA